MLPSRSVIWALLDRLCGGMHPWMQMGFKLLLLIVTESRYSGQLARRGRGDRYGHPMERPLRSSPKMKMGTCGFVFGLQRPGKHGCYRVPLHNRCSTMIVQYGHRIAARSSRKQRECLAMKW